MALIRGWLGGRRQVGGGGGWASWRRALLATRPQTVVLCPQQTTGMYTKHRIDREGHWQQFDTQLILISAPQWVNSPCNAPTWFYRVGKKPSVKADLAIYSHAVDVGGQCMSESLFWISVLVTSRSVFVNPVTYVLTQRVSIQLHVPTLVMIKMFLDDSLHHAYM